MYLLIYVLIEHILLGIYSVAVGKGVSVPAAMELPFD